MKISRYKTVFASVLCATTWGVSAETFPVRPVKIITPSSVGSGPDVALRIISEQLSKKWKQPVIVDNRPGGNGFVATGLFKQAKPDGHELITPDISHIATHPHTFSKLPYDARKDFEPIRPILNTAFIVAVGSQSPYQSLSDIVRAAQADPGKITYGSWFVGSPGHLGGLRLQSLKGIEMLHVPYRDMGQLMAAVAAGDVDWTLGSAASAGPLEKAGKLRFLSIAAPNRTPSHPNVPSVDENPDTKGYDVQAWVGLFAPAGTPAHIKQKISDDVGQILKTPEVVERYRLLGYENLDLGPAEFAARIERDTQSWGVVIKEAGLRLDD